ncbi:alcohol-forming fatty acyl-CoA reductase-like [Gossypium australe]|uniref:Alcohol-forming fatty acyl-CoA reductase-like n=1 Tax=Gossypium australe TaxID=47621 RepID=A0A5B6VLE9_9ROSI|nr:alcohol-forming fatty acyl-CoA reductase-like [Gossypium australe]
MHKKAILCKWFENGLNEDIRLLVEILELKEFVVLVDRACKADELNKEKRKALSEARDARKRPMSKSYQAQSKKSKKMNPWTTASVWAIQILNQSVQIVEGNILGSVRGIIETVTSVNCPEMDDKERKQEIRSSNVSSRGRSQKNLGGGISSRGEPRDSAMRLEGRVPTRTYAIRTREEASSRCENEYFFSS